MRYRSLAIVGFAAIALSTGGLVAVAQTTRPADPGTTSGKAADRRDTNRDGVISPEEKSEARRKAQERYKAADKNSDGALTREEARAGGFTNIERNFDAMDANRDGKVTPEERRAHANARKAERASAGSRKSEGGLLPPR
jgi:hypothetical protein